MYTTSLDRFCLLFNHRALEPLSSSSSSSSSLENLIGLLFVPHI
jgi:hypothetical protein